VSARHDPREIGPRERSATRWVALSLAGLDPTGGAGVLADVAVFRAHGLHGAAVATALTAQDSTGVAAVWPVAGDAIRRQAAAVLDDLSVRAIKIGMLGGAEQALAVAAVLRSPAASGIPVVLDPVIAPKAGVALLDEAGLDALGRELLPRVDLVTPNVAEAERLAGVAILDRRSLDAATRAILDSGARAVLVKGFRAGGGSVLDVLAERASREIVELRHDEVAGPAPHGTGCALSSAIAARLALGRPLRDAVAGAVDWLHERLARSARVGRGAPFLEIEAGEARS
jgi:hydroxymethylpyrimidine/phosphomethylpyrimidine kinase